jgi:uncharacterized repeat protein (TIGR01451 family)
MAIGDPLFTCDVEAATGDTQNLGVEFALGHWWVTGGNSGVDPNKLYKIDTNCNLVATFDQPANATGWGWRDLAWDGTFLYGSASNAIGSFDPAAETFNPTAMTGPENPNRALAWDPATDHFWTGNFSGQIYEFDRAGTVIHQYSNSLAKYGMAWDPFSPSGPYLWTWSQDPDSLATQYLFDGTNLVDTGINFADTLGIAGGAATVAELPGYPGQLVFAGLIQGTPDVIVGYDIEVLVSLDVPWLSEDPVSGTVPAFSDTGVEVTFDAGAVPEPGTYLANLNVANNDPFAANQTVAVTMTVLPAGDIGKLEGTVIGTGYCDGESYPAEADVLIENSAGMTWTTTADPAGYYYRWLVADTYTVTFSAPDHLPTTEVAQVQMGMTTTLDVALRYEESCMDVVPTSFSMTLPVDVVYTDTLSILNNGAGELMWEIRETTSTMALAIELMPVASGIEVPAAQSPLLADAGPSDHPVVAAPVSPDADVQLILDDGSSENALGLTAGGQFIWLNRFTPDPALFPFTLQEVQHYFYNGQGVAVGDVFDVYIYEDTDGDGDPGTGAVFLGDIQDVTAQALDAWSVWPLPSPVALNGPGDVLIVVVNRTTVAPGTYPATMDQTASQGRSWVGAYTGDPGDPPTLPADSLWGIVDSFGFAGNWMARGYGQTGTGVVWLDVPWVSEVPTNGVTLPYDTFDVDVVFDTHGLTVGECYEASLGLFHDDPGWDVPYMIPLTMCVSSNWPVFSLTKSGEPMDQVPGGMVTYTIAFGNDGDAVTGVTVSDMLPAGVHYVDSSPPGLYDPVAHGVVWSDLPLGAGVHITATIWVTIDESMVPPATLVNVATLDWFQEHLEASMSHYVVEPGYQIYLPVIFR